METKELYKAEGIDLSNLARLMLRWEEQRRQLDELEAAIKDTVLQLGKTQTVGYARASFHNPRKTYDYKTPGRTAKQDYIDAHTKPVTDWRSVCTSAGIDPIVTPGTGPGSVTLKLMS